MRTPLETHYPYGVGGEMWNAYSLNPINSTHLS